MELTARNIPFIKYRGLRFLEAAHVKDMVCLLRLVENPRDELAWFRVLQLVDGVGPGASWRITARVLDAGTTLLGLAAGVAGLPLQSQVGLEALAASLRTAAAWDRRRPVQRRSGLAGGSTRR